MMMKRVIAENVFFGVAPVIIMSSGEVSDWSDWSLRRAGEASDWSAEILSEWRLRQLEPPSPPETLLASSKRRLEPAEVSDQYEKANQTAASARASHRVRLVQETGSNGCQRIRSEAILQSVNKPNGIHISHV
jgi:hypothetical protein